MYFELDNMKKLSDKVRLMERFDEKNERKVVQRIRKKDTANFEKTFDENIFALQQLNYQIYIESIHERCNKINILVRCRR